MSRVDMAAIRSPHLLCAVAYSPYVLEPQAEAQQTQVWVTSPGDDHAVCLSVSGELDSYSVGTLEPKVIEYVEHRQLVQHLLIDLSAVTFCDAAGIGFLQRLHETLLTDGRFMTIHNPSAIVVRLLRLTDLDQWLPCTTVHALASDAPREPLAG